MSSLSNWQQVMPFIQRMDSIIDQTEELAKLHDGLVEELGVLRQKLNERFDQKTSYQLLFALAITMDERVLYRHPNAPVRWEPLQNVFFDVSEGGSLFYKWLENLLVEPATHPFVFELYTYCLRSGFRGIYSESPEKVDTILARLDAHLVYPKTPLAPCPPPFKPHTLASKLPMWAYGIATAALLLIHFKLAIWPDLLIR